MATVFSKILSGEIPCHKIHENNEFLAFLDLRPVNRGHTLVIPKKEVDYIFDMDDTLLSNIMPFTKKVAAAIKKTIPCKKIGIMVAGLEVPHAHIHLIPILGSVHELAFANAKAADPEELAETAKQIRAHLQAEASFGPVVA
ncbi:MAG TPA: HIT family protein [Candidatus Omnitrophica bacterium]|nr:HIT family protein [Candidatus Omnitrophota bacterium]